MLDINFISGSTVSSENEVIWKFLPLLGSVIGPYFGYKLGIKQAKRKENEADRRFYNYLIILIEKCETTGNKIIERLYELENEFDISDNNGRRIPDLNMLERFKELEQSKIFDTIHRSKEFNKKKLPPSETEIFELIISINYLLVGSNEIDKLMKINNDQIRDLRNNLIIESNKLRAYLMKYEKLIIEDNPNITNDINNNFPKDEFKLMKPKEFINLTIKSFENTINLRGTEIEEKNEIEIIINRCKELYENIEYSNKRTLSSESGGIKERRAQIETAQEKITKFINTHLNRTSAS